MPGSRLKLAPGKTQVLGSVGVLPGAPTQGVLGGCQGLRRVLGRSGWGGLAKCYWLMLEVYCHLIVKLWGQCGFHSVEHHWSSGNDSGAIAGRGNQGRWNYRGTG